MTLQEIELIRQAIDRKSKIAAQIEKHVKGHESIRDSMKNFENPDHPWYGDVKWRQDCDRKMAHHQRMIALIATQL